MGLFGQSSPFDADIEKATSEKNTTEPWGVIMDICDKVGSNPRNAKDCLKSIMRRMGHNDPHVVIQAITLLDACVNNCGKSYHLEVASREFETEFKRLLLKAQPQVASKMRLLLKKWAENDFKNDPQLNLIPSLYHKLKSEGHDFSDSQKASRSPPPPAAISNDPNVVSSQQEEEDIAKAIELSLKETKNSPKKQQQSTASPYASLYPSFSTSQGGAYGLSSPQANAAAPEPRKVRALYDFEAAEDNELTFAAGDIIHVQDDSDPNWWKGYNQNGEGLFPSNFVTADLSVEPEKIDINLKTKKTVQFDDEATQLEKTDNNSHEEQYVPEINEEKINRLLHLLHEANPEDPSQDSDEMLRLEEQVNKMGPLIDTELERVDRKHAQLTQLSSDLVDAINLYHTLMREPDRTTIPGNIGIPPYGLNMPPNLYGHNPMYSIPPMFHSTSQPQATNSMPAMHMMPGPPTTQQQQQQQSPMVGPNNFPHPQQMQIPMHYQNGHQQTPQQQQHTQQIPNSMPSNAQNNPGVPGGQPQAMIQQQSTHPPPPTSQTNPNFLPPNSIQGYTPQPNTFVPIPQGNFNVQQQPQHPSMLHHNGQMLGVMGQPQSLQISNQPQMPMPNHLMTAVNQPVTQTILGQNDSRTNIPIYQQQR